MHKNSIRSKSTLGFTLIELVLVMGITVIFLSITFAVFSIINTSHARVAVMNDAKDFADLNMQAIENLTADAGTVILSNTPPLVSGETGFTSVYFKPNATTKESALYYLVDGSVEAKAFTWDPYTIKNGTQMKWSILQTQPIFTTTATTGIIHIKLQIVDNATGNVYYTLQKDVILLNITAATSITGSSGTVIKVKDKTF